MSGLEEQLAAAVTEAGSLNDAVRNFLTNQTPRLDAKIGEMDAKQEEVDEWIATAMARLTMPRRVAFDPTVVYSKSSLALAEDPADRTRSVWHRLPVIGNSYLSGNERDLGVVVLNNAYSAPPGHNESPQYSSDVSRTVMQFVISNHTAATDDINARIASQGIEVPNAGNWGINTQSALAPVVKVPGAHGYLRPYVRFVNVAYEASGSSAAQNITNFGGDSTFALHEANVYEGS